MKLNLKELVNKDYDLVENFKQSGPINLMEFSNQYGVMIFAVGKEVFMAEGQQCFDIMHGKFSDLKKVSKNISLSYPL
jgi:hypothetical protein